MKHFFKRLFVNTLIGVTDFNSDQRKHAASTFRAIGFALIGAIGWTIKTQTIVWMALLLGFVLLVLAIGCEILALQFLSNQEDSDDE